MNIHEACAAILGEELAQEITEERGTHWAVIAAMTEATTSPEHAEACAVIRHWNEVFCALQGVLGEALNAPNAKPPPPEPEPTATVQPTAEGEQGEPNAD